jgi:hypothetical protein
MKGTPERQAAVYHTFNVEDLIDSQPGESPNPRQNADLRDFPPTPAAPIAAPGAEPPLPPDLAAVVAAWPALPPAVRAGIAAMVQASAPGR